MQELVRVCFTNTPLPLLQELMRHSVRDVVRVCEPTYKVDQLNDNGITVTDLVFDDGTAPPNEVSGPIH